MKTRFRIAAVTDEFCSDLERAADAMAGLGMTGAELRVVFGKNILDLTDEEVARARAILNARGLEIISLSSPLLKCVLPDAPPLDDRFEHDIFGGRHTFEDQPRLAARAFAIAHQTGARIVRVFSYWRTREPDKVFDRVAGALESLARQAAAEDLIIGIENEHACNVATGADLARLFAAVPHPNLMAVWDPGNARAAGEIPYPAGYASIPPGRIAHVHAKDCYVVEGQPAWGPLGACEIDWKGQFAALAADGYPGWVSLETHYPGPGNDKFLASLICGANLAWLLASD